MATAPILSEKKIYRTRYSEKKKENNGYITALEVYCEQKRISDIKRPLIILK